MGENFANRLQRLRHEAGVSQPELATAAGVPVASLRNWERARRLPYLDAAAKLARALRVTLDELAGEPEEMIGTVEPMKVGRPRKAAQAEAKPVKGKRKGGGA